MAKDDVAARKWYRKAADQGDASAQLALGTLAKDDTEQVKWYRKAAEQGDAMAQYFLGLFYARHEGEMKNLVEAYKWWSIAAASGDKNATSFRDRIAKKMTEDQIHEAQRLSREWRPKK